MSYIEIHLWDDWWEFVIDDFLVVLAAAGVSAEAKDINFTGFHSQGDGASFTGNFYLNKVDGDKLKEMLPEHHHYYIVEPLVELAKEHPKIQGRIGRIGRHYSHSNTMTIDEYSSDEGYCDEFTEKFEGDEDRLLQIFRNLADYLYSQLEDEYEYQIAWQTVYLWDDEKSDLAHAEEELKELKDSCRESLPSAEVQVKALDDQISHLESSIELGQSRIDQLSDQFHYWKDGKSLTIEEFRNEYF